MNHLLYPEYFDAVPLTGDSLAKIINKRAAQAAGTKQPKANVTVAIRTLNEADALRRLLADIRKQQFDGKIEIVVVDNESYDATPDVAREFGAKVIQLPRNDFTYPRSMNLAMEAAKYEHVFLTVGHANLSHDQLLRGGVQLLQAADMIVGGASTYPLLGRNASRWERYIASAARLDMRPRRMRRHRMGLLGATGAMINKSIWEELGRFDERFERGGEDGALSKLMIEHNYAVLFDPVISVHHTHGLGFTDTLRQWRAWQKSAKPGRLDRQALAARRPDLDLKR